MRGGVPTLSSREINSLVRAAISGTSLGGALDDAVGRVDRSRRSSSGGGGAGGLSSDESRSKGENGESGEAEHSGDDGTGSKYGQRWMLDVGCGGCEQEQHAGENLKGCGAIFKGRLLIT